MHTFAHHDYQQRPFLNPPQQQSCVVSRVQTDVVAVVVHRGHCKQASKQATYYIQIIYA